MLKSRRYLAAFLFIFSPLALAAVPQISISWSPSTIYVGQTSTLAWNVTGADSCVDQNGSSVGMTMNWTSSPRTVVGTQTKTLTCTGSGGTTTKGASLTVKALPPKPSINISWSPSTVYVGQTSTLSWSVSGADSCVDQSGASAGFSMNWTSSPRTSAGTQTKSLTCTNIAGSTSKGATLTVLALPNPPSVSTSFNKSSMYVGDAVTFSWSSSGASSCSLDGGSVSTSGSRTYTPGSAGTFSKSVSCSNIGGSNSSTRSVNVIHPAPTVSASFSNASIKLGGSNSLTWTSTNTTSCTIDGSSYGTSGSISLSPSAVGSTTKTVTCVGPGGSASDTASMNVTAPASPSISLNWSPNPVLVGEESTLTAVISNATYCEDGFPLSGATFPHSARTVNTSKTVSCYNETPLYSATQTSELIVNQLPAPVGLTSERLSNGDIRLSWSTFTHSNKSVLEYQLSTSVNNAPMSTPVIVGDGFTTEYIVTGATAENYQFALKVCYQLCSESALINEAAVPLPTINIRWEPAEIQAGESSTVYWSMANSTECWNDVTGRGVSGSEVDVVYAEVSAQADNRSANTPRRIGCANIFSDHTIVEEAVLIVTDPHTPQGLTATQFANGDMQLDWTATHKAPENINVVVEGANSDNWAEIATISKSLTSATVAESIASGLSKYRVSLCHISGSNVRCSGTNEYVLGPQPPTATITMLETVEPFESTPIKWSVENGEGCELKLVYTPFDNVVTEIHESNLVFSPAIQDGKALTATVECANASEVLATKTLFYTAPSATTYINLTDLSTQSIEDKINEAGDNKVVLTGIATLDKDLNITRGLDARSAVINTSIYKVIVNGLNGENIYLPSIISKGGTLGLEISNAVSSNIYISNISREESGERDGMLLNVRSGQISNNKFFLGKIAFFKRDIVIDCTNVTNPGINEGFKNNIFLGGQIARDTDKYKLVAGSILMTMEADTTSCIEGNTWFATSFEGSRYGTESRVKINGNDNNLINSRWEGTRICRPDPEEPDKCTLLMSSKPQITVAGTNNTIIAGYHHDYLMNSLKGDEDIRAHDQNEKTICFMSSGIDSKFRSWRGLVEKDDGQGNISTNLAPENEWVDFVFSGTESHAQCE